MNSDFEAPPKGWSIVSIFGGFLTALLIIVGMEHGVNRLRDEAQAGQTLPAKHSSHNEQIVDYEVQ